VPDLDVIGFRYGGQYGDVWGHRGMTHALFFAAVLSVILTLLFYFRCPASVMSRTFLSLFACGASQGFLDAMTKGGLGVAFLCPFDSRRYFFEFRPIAVSPIGVQQFFTERGAQALVSEFKWIGRPCLVFVVALKLFKCRRSEKRKA
jgi:inner membrane protein